MQLNYYLQRGVHSFDFGASGSSLQVCTGTQDCQGHSGGHMVQEHVIMELTEGLWQEDAGQGSDYKGVSDFKEKFALLDLGKLIFRLSEIFRVWCS